MGTQSPYLQAVRAFADLSLARGRDHYRARTTPLFVDGLNVDTFAPVEWLCDGQRWIICNPASQQDFVRTLVGLTNLTGDDRYRAAAAEAMQYFLDHYVDSRGLPKWGGHRFVDLRDRKSVV